MANFTKIAIKNSFTKLLNERPLSQITVKDIATECGINRNSFYYHFDDIPALIEEIVTESADDIFEQYPTIDSLETCLSAALHYVSQNRRAMLHIYNSVNRTIFEQYLWKICNQLIASYGNTVFGDKPISEQDKELILNYYECLCFGTVIGWLNGGMKENIEEKVHRICELKKGMLEEMIERCLENN